MNIIDDVAENFFQRDPSETLRILRQHFTPRPLREIRAAHDTFLVWFEGFDKLPRVCKNYPGGGGRIAVTMEGPYYAVTAGWDDLPAIPLTFIKP